MMPHFSQFEVQQVGRLWYVLSPEGETLSTGYSNRKSADGKRRRLLGLLPSPDLSKPKPSQRVARKCLCCPTQFLSEGPHNRLCPNCSGSVSRMDPRMI